MPTSETGTSSSAALRHGASRARGFSLLELLVVVAIIGIFTGIAVLSLGITGRDREIQQEAFRLKSLLSLVREEALMQNRDFGVEFTDTGYRFYTYDYSHGLWAEPVNDNLLKAHELRRPLGLSLNVEGRKLTLAPAGGQDNTALGDVAATGSTQTALDAATSAGLGAGAADAAAAAPGGDTQVQQVQPQVLILADGEITPFKATMFRDRRGATFTLSAQLDGTLEISNDAKLSPP